MCDRGGAQLRPSVECPGSGRARAAPHVRRSAPVTPGDKFGRVEQQLTQPAFPKLQPCPEKRLRFALPQVWRKRPHQLRVHDGPVPGIVRVIRVLSLVGQERGLGAGQGVSISPVVYSANSATVDGEVTGAGLRTRIGRRLRIESSGSGLEILSFGLKPVPHLNRLPPSTRWRFWGGPPHVGDQKTRRAARSPDATPSAPFCL
jgi:hypothetical protein